MICLFVGEANNLWKCNDCGCLFGYPTFDPDSRKDRCPACNSEALAPASLIVVEPWEDIELLLNQRGERDLATPIYAKVTEVVNGKDPVFRVSFTSVPPAAGAIVNGLVAGGEH